MTTERDLIRATLERLRAERFPHIDPQFVDAVIDAEVTAGDDDVKALRLISAAATRALAGQGE